MFIQRERERESSSSSQSSHRMAVAHCHSLPSVRGVQQSFVIQEEPPQICEDRPSSTRVNEEVRSVTIHQPTEEELRKRLGLWAIVERTFVQRLAKYAMKPHRIVKPDEASAGLDDCFRPDLVGELVGIHGYQDMTAKFLYHCYWLHVWMKLTVGARDLGELYSILDRERLAFGKARWLGPQHAKLAVDLAGLGLSAEDWDNTIVDWETVASGNPQLSEKQIDLLPRLVTPWEEIYSVPTSGEIDFDLEE